MKPLVPFLLVSALSSSAVWSHNHEAEATFTHTQLSDNLYMLQSGKGGNLALSLGEDGLLLIDDDYANVSTQTRAAIKQISDQPVKFLINTHWHFDHTGGNQLLGEENTIIVAHDNVRERLLKGGTIKAFDAVIPPAEKAALPVITFAQSMSFHWNNETIDVIHPSPSAHTDGDAVIFFKNDNVVHMGDLYFNKMYPFIDGSSGGSVSGVISSVNTILKSINDDTKVIPGHGALSNKKELTAYRDMLKIVHNKLSTFKKQGMSLEDVIAAKPTAEFDKYWGNGFLKTDVWLGIIYSAL